jgi:hypothetical protein
MTTTVRPALVRHENPVTAVPFPRIPPEAGSDIWSDLEDSMGRRFNHIDRDSIRSAIAGVRAEYANVRVRAYVHILAERDVIDRLRKVDAVSRSVAV